MAPADTTAVATTNTTTTTSPVEWGQVDKYTVKHLQPTSPPGDPHEIQTNEALAWALENCRKSNLPDIAVSASQGKFLQLQARLLGARSILEIGTLGGYSTIWLATARPDARVVSLEVNPEHAEVALQNLTHANLLLLLPLPSHTNTNTNTTTTTNGGAEVRVGAALDSLADIEEEVLASKERRPFDLVFLDADKENNWNYVDRVAKLCRRGALIVVDNVGRGGRLADPSSADSRVLGARKVVENVGRDPRFEATVLQTVGDKGYDGFLFVYVK